MASPVRDLAGPLVLVGAGKMGSALLEGWLALGLDPTKILVIEPHPSAEVAAHAARGLRLNPDLRGLKTAAIVIAVKPQIAAEVVPALSTLIGDKTVTISIMAGRTLATLEKALPANDNLWRVVRKARTDTCRDVNDPCFSKLRNQRISAG